MEALRQYCYAFDQRVADSLFGRFFRLEGCGHEREIKNSRFTTEIRAGVTTFFTMAYIISVNAAILTDSGGTCVCTSTTDSTCANDAAYNQCLNVLNRDFITATAAIAAFASFVFGLVTNMPVCLANGMGLNAYFAYQVVGYHGTGRVSYGLALTAVFVEGFIFIVLSLLGMRQWLVRMLPTSLKIASAVGIGLFLAEIGLSYSAGIGAITGGGADTPLALGGCPTEYLDPTTGMCTSHEMRNPAMWIGIFGGGALTAYLMTFKVKSAMIVGIAVVSIISWPRNTSFTYFPHTPDGDEKFEFFKKVATFHPIKNTLNALDWDISAHPGHFILALITFLYVDIIDCTATLYSMARFSGVVDPETGDFPRSTLAYCTDALSISIGALFGTAPCTAFIESGAGIAEGGRTGLTAMTCGLCFFVSIFFAPIFASIPPWATGCTLILVGCMMVRQVVAINWRYIGDAVPAFVTIICVPLTYSTAYGVIAGMLAYAAINLPIFLTKLLSGGRIVPDDEEEREYWSYKPHGTPLPFFLRVARSAIHAVAPASNHPSSQHREVPSRGSDRTGTTSNWALKQKPSLETVMEMTPNYARHSPSDSGIGDGDLGAGMVREAGDETPVIERFDLRRFRVQKD
ncbi:xanthine/uracil permease family protein-like protein [Saccharata proteae CBS 121410]|uniref:Xanthine/uracil permease family protein-like protein n=1 Tax=Saccharata proteae CBS 121410 TaxID=1314787 RepID=A0A9P4HYR1_9PEZI|nr:xanthine/uracil permease family protein-like protein [Saccharata proteae CBS 121410]